MSYLPNLTFFALYFAYTISCLGDRIWTFSIIFVLSELGGLRLVTINQLFQGLSQMVLASYVGNWYDNFGRQIGVQLFLGFNNLSIAASAALLAVTLHLSKTSESYYYLITLIFSIIFCSISMAAASGEKLAFSKDWIVVMVQASDVTEEGHSEGDEQNIIKQQKRLSAQNAILTVLDMLAAIIAPLGSGFVLKHFGLLNGCLVIVGWNILGWASESAILFWIYQEVEALSIKKLNNPETSANEIKQENRLSIIQMFKIYFSQAVFPAALGLSFLYMTVLAFDGISISFGEREGFDASILGTFQSIGSALGMTAALSFPFLASKFGLSKTAFFGLTAELIALGICIVSVFLPGSPFDLKGYFGTITIKEWWQTFLDTFKSTAATKSNSMNETSGMNWSKFEVNSKSADSLFFLFTGITLARFGLWLTDLAITQIMQETVIEEKRGTIFGVENALCQFFSVSKDIFAILLPDSKTFGILVFISVAAVAAAFFLFICHLFNSKKKQT
uniref:Solute carrier family 40 member n=1 Tax=Panagrolaimus sp. PS1159 TaxID=55785 RepID=A0AC35FSW2_9BILA